MSNSTTDDAWRAWGERDPYYAVITDPKFRAGKLTEAAKQEFFESGRQSLGYVLSCCQAYLGATPAPGRALDFGCGVGRVALPMAERFAQVVGVDVSPAMLAEAARNAAAGGQSNLTWVGSDDALSAVTGQFDLVHSAITLQHIDVARGRRLFQRLVDLIAPGGFGAIQVTYGKTHFAQTFGQPDKPQHKQSVTRRLFSRSASFVRRPSGSDPEMQMNAYNLSELAFILHAGGIQRFHTEFSDHGGELGVFYFMQKPGSGSDRSAAGGQGADTSANAEPVRLVIWDLDETFWQGTLTEGSIQQVAANIQILKTLAERGIVSSICSKNDFERVKAVLEAEGLWDYFILPSIDWTPKGQRIQHLIEDAQLRPGSVLFIDDNPQNLHEARRLTPDLQIAGPEIIAHLLEDPRLKGKDDRGLTRLDQYKLLERRQRDANAAGVDKADFLRSSGIRVEIVHDIEAHIDRAVELINRTNQLNFTKVRLADDVEQARRELRALVADAQVQAGLIRVRDNYGDHGFCGIYVLAERRILHFAFSCRILGMGIESWVYQRLGSPYIHVVGEVLTDIHEQRDIDWINPVDAGDGQAVQHEFPFLIARGGCDLDAIAHYLQFVTPRMVGEFNVSRNGLDMRRDHSIFLRHALDGIQPEQLAVAERLGYTAEDFRSELLTTSQPGGVYLLSFIADLAYALYRHRETGLRIPFSVPGCSNHREDGRKSLVGTEMPGPVSILEHEFDYEGPIPMAQVRKTVSDLLDRLPAESHVFIVGANETLHDKEHRVTHTWDAACALNDTLRALAVGRPRVHILQFRDFIQSEDEVQNWSHFERLVYFRTATRLRELARSA